MHVPVPGVRVYLQAAAQALAAQAPTANETSVTSPIVRPSLLLVPETLDNWMDGRISCWHSLPTCFLVFLSCYKQRQRVVLQRMQFAAKNRPEHNQWFHRDVDAMCQQLDASPVFIDADRSID